MKKIFILEAEGPQRILIGHYSSKEKANKAWRRWKYAFRGTIWGASNKILLVDFVNVLHVYGKVVSI
jgi:hypothetical protein